MDWRKTDDTQPWWGSAEITQVDGSDVVSPGPQTLYRGTAYPVK